MAYSSQFYNKNGDLVFDALAKSLYLHSSGTTTKVNWYYNVAPSVKPSSVIDTQGGASSVGQWSGSAGGTGTYPVYNSVSTTFTTYTAWWNNATFSFHNSVFDFDDMAFVSIPTEGILQMEHLNCALPDFPNGSNFLVASTSTGNLSYKVFSKNIAASTETHGMLIYSDTGTLLFDSRNSILGVEFFEISVAQVQDILLNNAVIDLTLSKSIPNAFVSSPEWMAYTSHSTTSGCGRWIKITQPNSTTIRLSRHSIGPNTTLCNNTYNNYIPLKLFICR